LEDLDCLFGFLRSEFIQTERMRPSLPQTTEAQIEIDVWHM
jgi:hypothetical protein